MKRITLVYFEGCPNAQTARQLLESLGVPFQEVEQTKLAENDPLRGYSSPSVLVDGELIYGAATRQASGGCSVEPLDVEKLRLLIVPPMGVHPKTGKSAWLAQVGSILSALLVWFCPACIPAVAGFLSAIGLGFLLKEEVVRPLFIALMLFTVGSLFWSYRKEHQKPYPFLLGSVATVSLCLSQYIDLGNANAFLIYIGVAGLIGASMWNLLLRKKVACSSCSTGPAH